MNALLLAKCGVLIRTTSFLSAWASLFNPELKVILLNNSHLGLVRQQQHLFYGKRYCASRFVAQTDFVAIARGFGVPAVDLCEARDPVAALEHAIKRPGPCLVNVPIAPEENVYPMVPPGGANRDMIGGEFDDAKPA